MGTGDITRRQIIAAGVGGLAITLIEPVAASAATTGTAMALGRSDSEVPPLGMRATQIAPLRYYSADFSTRFQAAYPTAVELSSSAPIPQGARGALSFDVRAFEPSAVITMVRGRGVKSTPTLAGVEGNSGLLEFTIDREIGRDDSAVVLIPPLNSKPLYPNENIGALEPVVLTVTSPAGDHSASLPLVGEPVATPSAPWGLELAGVWGDAKVTELRKERLYRYPTFVQLMSVGPSAVPAGGVLTLDVDAGVVSSLAVNTISRDGVLLGRNAFSAKEDTGRGSLRLDITLADQVLPEEVITVLLTTALVEGQPDLEGVTIARAKFAASETDARPQRDTGRSTFIDVTNSGSSSSAAVAMGTV